MTFLFIDFLWFIHMRWQDLNWDKKYELKGILLLSSLMYWEILASAWSLLLTVLQILEIWWLKFKLIIKCYTKRFFKSWIRILFSLIFASSSSFLLMSKRYLFGLAYIPLFLNHSKMVFEDFFNWVITSPGVFTIQYGVLLSA